MTSARNAPRWVVAAILAAVAMVMFRPAPAPAAAPSATGWWWVGGGTPAPLAPPNVPAGGLYVAGNAAGQAAVSAVRYVAPRATGGTIVFTIASATGTPALVACLATSKWTSVEGGSWDTRPTFNCAAQSAGVVSADGRTVSFAVGAPDGGIFDLVLVPLPTAGPNSTAPFDVTFERPGVGSLAASTEGGDEPAPPAPRATDDQGASSTPAPAPPSGAAPSPSTGALASPAAPLQTTPTDAPASAATASSDATASSEPGAIAAPVSLPLPAPAGKGASWPYFLLLSGLGLLVTVGRRSYQPTGSFVDVVIGRSVPGAAPAGALPALVERAWRVALPALIVLAVWVGAARHLPQGLPPGVVLYGVIVGGLIGLLSVGVILVYRTNRVINFAQAAFGAVGLVLTFELTFQAKLPYFVSAVIGIATSAALAGASEVGVMRRFRQAPRLIVTLATIGLTSIVIFVSLIVVVLFERNAEQTAVGSVLYPSPLRGKAFTLSGIVFSYDVVLAMVVVPVVMVALMRFLRRSWFGMGMRAVAENTDRAGLLAIPVGRLSTLAWIIAGGLSALATILRAPITGYSLGGLNTTGSLAVMLTAVVLGRLDNVAWAFLGGIAIGVADQVYFYNFAKGSHLDLIHLVFVLAAFVVLPRATNRAAWNEVSSWRAFREVRPIPREVRDIPIVRIARPLVPALIVLPALLLPVIVHDFHAIRIASLMGIWAIAAVSLVVLTGWAGQISLGQWSIVGVGAFVAAKLLSGSSPANLVVVLVAAGAAGGLVAALLGIPALRLRGIYLAIVTFVFATAAFSVLFTWPSFVPKGDLARPPLVASEQRIFYLVLGVLILTVVATRNIRNSRLGRLLIASRDNEMAAQSYGADLFRVRVSSFVISGVFAGIAGGLYALMTQSVHYTDFNPGLSLQVFAIAVIGGLGSIPGAIIGAVYVVGAGYLLPSYGPFLATGLGMLVFLLVFPGGLGSLVYAARDALLRRVAVRHGISSSTLTEDRRIDTDPLMDDAPMEGVGPPTALLRRESERV